MAIEPATSQAPPRAVEGLPLELSLAGRHAAAMRTWVEGVAGWQPVDHLTAPLIPPVLVLADVAGAPHARRGLPLVLLVCAEDTPAAAAAAAVGSSAVVAWPGDRERLFEVAVSVGALETASASGSARELRVAGACGGVGTTTVALALGGLVAWRGAPCLVVGHGEVPVPTSRPMDASDLAGSGTWDVASAVPGLSRLKVITTTAPATDEPVDAGPARLVVRDLGVSEDGDILVLRRDGAGIRALERSAAAVAIVVDSGVAPTRAVRTAAGGRRLVVAEWSNRVARAAFAQRVPAGLPGRWLRSLGSAMDGPPS